MSHTKVTVMDYGIGNVFSVLRALSQVADVHFTADAKEAAAADRLVVPGVGAFADCMNQLTGRGLADVVKEFSQSGRPMLGICVGMQMLFDRSEEFGNVSGLGILPGHVREIASKTDTGERRKIPHIGWSPLQLGPNRADWSGSVLSSLNPGATMYFVHSFSVIADNPDHVLAAVDYEGYPVTAAIQSGNVFGTQFHPERSAANGQSLLKAFVSI